MVPALGKSLVEWALIKKLYRDRIDTVLKKYNNFTIIALRQH